MFFMVLGLFLLGFIAGFIAGVNAETAFKDSKLSEELEKTKSLTEKMKRVSTIAQEQMDLAGRINMPQQNSLDGKYKNMLLSQLKNLDDEKMTILKSILSDGHDPQLSAMDEAGVVTKMKLSEYLASQGITIASKGKDKSKFVVFRGGKDDGNNTTH